MTLRIFFVAPSGFFPFMKYFSILAAKFSWALCQSSKFLPESSLEKSILLSPYCFMITPQSWRALPLSKPALARFLNLSRKICPISWRRVDLSAFWNKLTIVWASWMTLPFLSVICSWNVVDPLELSLPWFFPRLIERLSLLTTSKRDCPEYFAKNLLPAM